MCANMFRILAEKQRQKPPVPLQCIKKAARNKNTCLMNKDNMPCLDIPETDSDICPVKDICNKEFDVHNMTSQEIVEMVEFQNLAMEEKARKRRIKDLQAQEKKYMETFERAALLIEKGENAFIKTLGHPVKQSKKSKSKETICPVPPVCAEKGQKKTKVKSGPEDKMKEKIKCLCEQNQGLVQANVRNESEIKKLQCECDKLRKECDGIMAEKLQMARKKCRQIEEQIKDLSKNFEDCACERTRELNDMKSKCDQISKKRGELKAVNRELLCNCDKLTAKRDHLDEKLTAQKQNEDVLLKNMNEIMCEKGCGGMLDMTPASGAAGPSGRSEKAQARACNLLGMAARLTEALHNVEVNKYFLFSLYKSYFTYCRNLPINACMNQCIKQFYE